MSVATLPDVEVDTHPVEHDDGDLVLHNLCCSDDIAMCGEDLTGMPWAVADEQLPECPLCVQVRDRNQSCPVPGCPYAGGRLRRAWNRLRGYR